MENNKLGQEPAFANRGHIYEPTQQGISKRFYAACVAMQGLLANSVFMDYMVQEYPDNTDKEIVRNAYKLADELLRQENL